MLRMRQKYEEVLADLLPEIIWSEVYERIWRSKFIYLFICIVLFNPYKRSVKDSVKVDKKYFQWVNTCKYYEYALLREGKHNRESSILVVVTSLSMELKDAYMMFMLHLNQDFDDDLLLDALRKLVDDLWMIMNNL